MRQPVLERGWRAFDELTAVSSSFELILDVNDPEARDYHLDERGSIFAPLLRQQQPVGGMAGRVNQTLVRQFRMPGYPFVLVTTDLLQEGEDLHTFCSAVHHYGISWTPSSMEQRIGRIDRVRSHTDRRLSLLTEMPEGHQKLQVYFPHLQDTVEFLQVRRLLARMGIFLQLMHEGLGSGMKDERRIDTTKEFERSYRFTQDDDRPLKSSFPVRPKDLVGRGIGIKELTSHVRALTERFERLRAVSVTGSPIEWEGSSEPGSIIATGHVGKPVQPITLMLDMYGNRARVRCISPIGYVDPDAERYEIITIAWRLGLRVGAVCDPESRSYNLTVEEDVLLGADSKHDLARVGSMLGRVITQADQLEEAFFSYDHPLETFRDDLEDEYTGER